MSHAFQLTLKIKIKLNIDLSQSFPVLESRYPDKYQVLFS